VTNCFRLLADHLQLGAHAQSVTGPGARTGGEYRGADQLPAHDACPSGRNRCPAEGAQSGRCPEGVIFGDRTVP